MSEFDNNANGPDVGVKPAEPEASDIELRFKGGYVGEGLGRLFGFALLMTAEPL